MKKIIIAIACFFAGYAGNAQLLDSASHEITRINRVFDSSMYFGFDMSVHYQTDSSGAIMNGDEVFGKYLLNRSKMYYLAGSTEYVQTDSFTYMIYNDEQTMIMSKNKQSAGSHFPLQSFNDSIMTSFATKYDVFITTYSITDTTSEPGDTTFYDKIISFKIKTTAPEYNTADFFQSFDIYYDKETYYPSKIRFKYFELNDMGPAQIPVTPFLAKKTIDIDFSRYSHIVGTDVFNDAKYVIYNRQRKIYETTQKYSTYRFLSTGFDNDDEEAKLYNEVPWDYNAPVASRPGQ